LWSRETIPGFVDACSLSLLSEASIISSIVIADVLPSAPQLLLLIPQIAHSLQFAISLHKENDCRYVNLVRQENNHRQAIRFPGATEVTAAINTHALVMPPDRRVISAGFGEANMDVPAKIIVRNADGEEHKRAIAELLFERDNAYVPVTPLTEVDEIDAESSKAPRFFVASIDDRPIRACASYAEWILGADAEGDAESSYTQVFELASTLVRKPLGGFSNPTMQQILAFARIMEIIGLDLDQTEGRICIIACIARENDESRSGIAAIGMEPLWRLPRWMRYEHRVWFPKMKRNKRRSRLSEGHYFWLPPASAKKFIESMIPYVEGKVISRRSLKDPAERELFVVDAVTETLKSLRKTYGSLRDAVGQLNFDMLREPPSLAKIGSGFF
jgi:hypothetical protein